MQQSLHTSRAEHCQEQITAAAQWQRFMILSPKPRTLVSWCTFTFKILRRNCECELLICMQQSLHTSRAEHCDPLHSSISQMQDRRVSRQSSKALLCLDCLSHSDNPNPLKPLRQISLRQSTCENIVEKDNVARLYHWSSLSSSFSSCKTQNTPSFKSMICALSNSNKHRKKILNTKQRVD